MTFFTDKRAKELKRLRWGIPLMYLYLLGMSIYKHGLKFIVLVGATGAFIVVAMLILFTVAIIYFLAITITQKRLWVRGRPLRWEKIGYYEVIESTNSVMDQIFKTEEYETVMKINLHGRAPDYKLLSSIKGHELAELGAFMEELSKRLPSHQELLPAQPSYPSTRPTAPEP